MGGELTIQKMVVEHLLSIWGITFNLYFTIYTKIYSRWNRELEKAKS
jgi:hypothetical protein